MQSSRASGKLGGVQVSEEPAATAYPSFSCNDRVQAEQRVAKARQTAAEARDLQGTSSSLELVRQLVDAQQARFQAPTDGQPCSTAWLQQLELVYASAMHKLARQHKVQLLVILRCLALCSTRHGVSPMHACGLSAYVCQTQFAGLHCAVLPLIPHASSMSAVFSVSPMVMCTDVA